jgi:antirestriction protein ArdC
MAQPLRLLSTDPKLAALCQAMQDHLAEVAELQQLEVNVVLLPNFNSLPEAEAHPSIRQDCAVYRPSTNTIYVNESIFESQEPDVMNAIMAHELGHACAHHLSLMKALSTYAGLGEEYLADRLACVWGFHEPLSRMRKERYRQAYVDALKLWPDEAAYCKAMRMYDLRKQAGLA